MTFLLQHGHKPFLSLIYCTSDPTGITCLRANSYSFSHKFARITARDAPIAKPSTYLYHELLHLKYTLLTAIFKSLFMVALLISGGDSWLYSFCKAISIASFRGTLVCKLFTSRDIMVINVFNCFSSLFSIGF